MRKNSLRKIVDAGVCLLFALFLSNIASAQVGTDVVGVYFDTNYTQDSLDDFTAPSFFTGYLVLHNPSSTAGVAGWELCAEIMGAGQFSSWVLEGQTINTSTPPCFTVGIGGPPLLPGENVLLATFQIIIEDNLPVTISLVPKFNSSLPNQMSYLDGADLNSIIPLTTVTGSPEVAFFHKNVPSYEVSPTSLPFLNVHIGGSETQTVTVTNSGGGFLQLDIGLAGDCSGFSLPGVSGPVSLGAGESTMVDVSFAPLLESPVDCDLVLGELVPNVPMVGTGHIPIIAWTVNPGSLDFGLISSETSKVQSVTVRNTGEAPFTIEPSVDDPTGSFVLASSGGIVTLVPGASQVVEVAFSPVAGGDFTGLLNLGDTIDPVSLVGQGYEGVFGWDAPQIVVFGDVSVGTTISSDVVIANVGTALLPLSPFVSDPNGVFAITSGGDPLVLSPGLSHTITIDFSPVSAFPYAGTLDLGFPVGLITLQGTGSQDPVNGSVPNALPFGDVEIGQTTSLMLPVTNSGMVDLTFTPNLVFGDAAFSILSGGGTTTVPPGEIHNIEVGFAPFASQSFIELMELGDVLGNVLLTGTGIPGSQAWSAPTSVDFGSVAVGVISERTITISSIGTEPFSIDVSIPTPSDFYVLNGGGSFELSPGMDHPVTIGFLPQTAGTATGTLELGSTVPAIALTGEVRLPVTSFLVTPEALNFGNVAVGYAVTATVTLDNTGDTIIEVDPTLVTGDPGFSLLTGAGVSEVQPGSSFQVQVQFLPTVVGSFSADLNLGFNIPNVSVSGVAEEPNPGCAVSPEVLVFGSVDIGWPETRYINITNTGNTPLTGTPSFGGCTYFSADTTTIVLNPGQQTILPVRFLPPAEGSWSCNLDLGIGECAQVLCTGDGVPTGIPGALTNVAMVFFDEGYDYNSTQTLTPNEIITGYLVLQYPTDSSGVGGWEGRLALDGEAEFVDFTLEGQFINVDTPPSFTVGIGGSPLPYSGSVLLASFRCLITSPWSQVDVLFGPTWTASIPDFSAWIPWADPTNLLPMQQFPGQLVVAAINSPLVGIEAPTPLATVTGSGVALSWNLDDVSVEGCHVYRRLEGLDEVRLTTNPIIPLGQRFTFNDPAEGVAPGSSLSYSYAVIRDGVEKARSPEVTVTLGGVPSTLTRLLPNIPNPFNPQTEVRFELATANHIRITIYDVTGRKVATLVDEDMGPGPQTIIWQGRDDAGRPLPSGAYYLRLDSGDRVDHRKVLLLK